MKSICYTVLILVISSQIRAQEVKDKKYLDKVIAYAETMLKDGRDDTKYGPETSPMFAVFLRRETNSLPDYPIFNTSGSEIFYDLDQPGGWAYRTFTNIPMMSKKTPDNGNHGQDKAHKQTVTGSDPLENGGMYLTFNLLSHVTGDAKYANAVSEALNWFSDKQAASGLYPFGEHSGWDFRYNSPQYLTTLNDKIPNTWKSPNDAPLYHCWEHEPNGAYEKFVPFYNYLRDNHPERFKAYAKGLWAKHFWDKEKGSFNRHGDIYPDELDGWGSHPDDLYGSFPRMTRIFAEVWTDAYLANENDQSFRDTMVFYLNKLIDGRVLDRTNSDGSIPFDRRSGSKNPQIPRQYLSMIHGVNDAANQLKDLEPELAKKMYDFTNQQWDWFFPWVKYDGNEDGADWANTYALGNIYSIQYAHDELHRPKDGLTNDRINTMFWHYANELEIGALVMSDNNARSWATAIDYMISAYEKSNEDKYLNKAKSYADLALSKYFDNTSDLPKCVSHGATEEDKMLTTQNGDTWEPPYDAQMGSADLMYSLLKLYAVINDLSTDPSSAYLISYQLDGGTTDNPTSYTAIDETITLKNASKVGFTFDGWYTDADFTKSITKIETGSTGNLKIYAKFTPIIYQIVYNLDGGTSTNPKTYTAADKTIKLKEATKSGLTFVGWYTDAQFINQVTEITTGSIGDKTFYARFSATAYTITYHLEGGTATNPVAYDSQDPSLVLNPATKIGYTFHGWYTDAGLQNKITQIDKGTSGDLNLYAKFGLKNYQIIYELDGGISTNPSSYTIKDETITLKNASKTGFTFEGWYTDAEFKNEITEIKTGSIGDMKVYAKFGITKFKITYHNGGTNSNPDSYSNQDETIVLKDASKTGYTFVGWYTDAEFKNEITEIVSGSTGDLNIFGKYSTTSYNVWYQLDGGILPVPNPATYSAEDGNVPLNPAQKDGFTFAGWYRDKSFNDPIALLTPSVFKGNLNLYAKYIVGGYSITYHLDGGVAYNPVAYSSGDGIVDLKDASKAGFTFIGWYTDPNFTTLITELTASTVSSNMDIYAKYEGVITSITKKTVDELKIFPNPCVEKFRVNVVFSSVQIFTFNGSLIKTFIDNTQPLDVVDIPTGQYVVIITDTFGNRKITKLVKH